MNGILQSFCPISRVRQNNAINVPNPDSGVSVGRRGLFRCGEVFSEVFRGCKNRSEDAESVVRPRFTYGLF